MAPRRTAKTDPAAGEMPGRPVLDGDMQLLLARSLFRSDKWDPKRDAAQPFEWEPKRSEYMAKSARLLRVFAKDGLDVSPR